MKYIKLALLITLVIALAGCGDDDYDGGGESGDGSYGTYWGVIETFSAEGYVPEMTQKPEAPAPKGDQEECPGVIALALLLLAMYIFWHNKDRWIIMLAVYLERDRGGRPFDDGSKRPVIASLPPTVFQCKEDTTTLL